MGRINEDLKNGNLKNVYLLYGEESYLRNFYKNKLVSAMVSPEDNLNYSYFEGAGISMEEVAGLAVTMPFLADRRVIVLENTGWFGKGSDDEEGSEGEKKNQGGASSKIADVIGNLSEEVCMIFSESKIDKRSKTYKLIDKNGVAEEFARQSPQMLKNFLLRIITSEGKKIRCDTMDYFLSELGDDMYFLELEISKVIAYCMEREEITVKDIDEVCTHRVSNKIFDMINAIIQKKQKVALELYYDLLVLRESPFYILAMLSKQFYFFYQVAEQKERGKAAKVISDTLGENEWRVKKTLEALRNCDSDKIRKCLEACARADEDIKSGRVNDLLSVELLLISCASE